jgi:hypothetical protein
MSTDSARSPLEQAVSRSLRSRISKVSDQISEAEFEELDQRARKSWLPLIDGFGLDERQVADIMSLALHCQIEMRHGRMTQERVRDLDAKVYADLRAAGYTNRQIGAKLEALNARLFHEKPDVHAALDRGYPLGHYPQVMRPLMAWHDRRTADDGFKKRSIAARMVPAGGTTAAQGATALRSLGRSPLDAA